MGWEAIPREAQRRGARGARPLGSPRPTRAWEGAARSEGGRRAAGRAAGRRRRRRGTGRPRAGVKAGVEREGGCSFSN